MATKIHNKIKSRKVTIIDYGMGNIGSLSNAFRYLGANVNVSRDLSPGRSDLRTELLIYDFGHHRRRQDPWLRLSILHFGLPVLVQNCHAMCSGFRGCLEKTLSS